MTGELFCSCNDCIRETFIIIKMPSTSQEDIFFKCGYPTPAYLSRFYFFFFSLFSFTCRSGYTGLVRKYASRYSGMLLLASLRCYPCGVGLFCTCWRWVLLHSWRWCDNVWQSCRGLNGIAFHAKKCMWWGVYCEWVRNCMWWRCHLYSSDTKWHRDRNTRWRSHRESRFRLIRSPRAGWDSHPNFPFTLLPVHSSVALAEGLEEDRT